MSFCNSCIEREERDFYCCANCNSTKIKSRIKNDTLTGVIFVCMDCKSTNIRHGKLSKKICPNCKSDMILTIIEKRKQLIQTFHDTIKNFKYGYNELKKFVEDCRIHKQELITLRNLGYKHDAKIEHSLLWIYNTINKIKKEIMDHFQRDFNLIRSKIYQFMDLDTWNPANFYEIETIIEHIKKNVSAFMQYVDALLKPMIENLRILKSKISVIQYYKLIYDEYKSEIKLRTNELPVSAFKRIQFIKLENMELPSKRGVLFLTNKRLIFIYKKGILKKVKLELFSLELSKIQNAFISGKIFKKLKILTNSGFLILNGPDKILNAIIHYLNIAMNFKNYSNDDSYLIQRLSTIDIEISDLKNNINEYISQILRKNLNPISMLNIDNQNKNIFGNQQNQINPFTNNYNSISNINSNTSRISNINSNKFANNANIHNHQQRRAPSPSYNPPQLPYSVQNLPQPASINITIPISQHTERPKLPFATVISNEQLNVPVNRASTPVHTQTHSLPRNPAAMHPINRNIQEPNEIISNNNFITLNRENPNLSMSNNFHSSINTPPTAETRPLIKLYEDKFAIEKTIENIENLFNSGRISPEVYFKQYRPLQKELFTINKMIKELEGK
ncbi:MAG: hypothetical protein ACTSPQ_05765 [Candidatus Helarchaeota archaeon]